jgi:hypothetical protein
VIDIVVEYYLLVLSRSKGGSDNSCRYCCNYSSSVRRSSSIYSIIRGM